VARRRHAPDGAGSARSGNDQYACYSDCFLLALEAIGDAPLSSPLLEYSFNLCADGCDDLPPEGDEDS
jgi:hypothetical protein